MPKFYGGPQKDHPPFPPKTKTEPEHDRDPVAALHATLREIIDDVEDMLSMQYRINATVEIGDGDETARLIYRRTGDPPRWALFVAFAGTARSTQQEIFGSSPLRWRCAAVRALPALLVELQKEQRAADESLNEAVRLAAAFREQMQGGER